MTRYLYSRLALAGSALFIAVLPALARDVRVRNLTLTNAWTRPTPPAAPAGAGYLTIENSGAEPDRLVGGTSPAVRDVQVHEMTFTGGVMRMRPVEGGLVIPARGSVTLGPGGYHMMLIGPRRSFKVGGHIPVTLRFQRAGEVKVSFDVRNASLMPVSGGAH